MDLPIRLIVDTSILINYLRDRLHTVALKSVEEVYLPAIVLAEVQTGWLRSHGDPHRQIRRFRDILSSTVFLPIVIPTVECYVEIRRSLELNRAIIPDNDIWIAAAAKEHDLPLLTNDAHFRRVDGITVLDPADFDFNPRIPPS